MLQLLLRRCGIKGTKPTVTKPAAAGELAQGELWLNNNHESPGLFARADDDTLIEFTPEKLFLQDGADAKPRTHLSKLKDVISAKDFGAVGNGIADDRLAIQAAIKAAAGRTLYFPAGTYLINVSSSASVGVVPAGTTFLGDGNASFLDIRATDTSYANVFYPTNDNIAFENLKIKLTLLAGGQAALFNFSTATSSGFRLSNCELASSSSAANSTQQSYLVNCSTGNKDDVLIENCTIHNWHFPILKTNTSAGAQRRWKIVGNYFYDNGGHHWAPNSPMGIHDDVLIQGNSFGDTYGTDAGKIHFVGLASVTNCRIVGNTMIGRVAGEAIHLEENCRNVVIDGNTIEVRQLTDNAVNGNGIRMVPNSNGGTMTYPNNVTITGNTIRRIGVTGGIGIDLANTPETQPSVAWAAISNNIVDGFTTGIVVEPDVLTARVTNNVLKSCTTGISLPRGGSPLVAQNTFSLCATGVFGRGLIGPSYFNETKILIDSEFDGMAATTGWSTQINNIALTASGATAVILVPAGSRFDGNLRWSFYAPTAGTQVISGSHNLSFDGTTLTQNALNTRTPGTLAVAAPTVSGGNLVFNIYNSATAARTGGRLYCEFIGMHIFT